MDELKFKISKLAVKELQLSETEVFPYYEGNYKFVCASHKDGKFKNIPILNETSKYMEDNNINLPIEYCEGFVKEYERNITFENTKKGFEWILRHVMPDPVFFHADWFELGVLTARAYKAWEIIIDRLPEFEQYFSVNQVKEFATFLIHDKAPELAEKLSSIIKDGKGKHVALCLTALKELQLINYSQAQNVYDSLKLNKSQCTGANDYLNPNNNKLKEEDKQAYKSKIQSIIDSL